MYNYKKKRHKRNLPIILFIYLYAFFIFYMPRISDLLINIHIEFFSVLLLCIILVPYLLKRQRNIFIFKKNITYLILGIFISSIYFACRASLGSNELRLLQNNFIIIQIMHGLVLLDILKRNHFKKDEIIKLLLNLALIQGIICILMLLMPQFKEIALNLYYIGREENIFISRSRIYGISSDYTFFTPVYHGILASVAAIYAIFKSYKYLFYLPFILLAILLNGRIGLIVFVIGTIVGYFVILMSGKQIIKTVRYIFIIIIIMGISLVGLREVSPYTYDWILGGVEDTIVLLTNNELKQNYTALFDTMLYFPEGCSLIFGEGHRVYGEHGITRGYIYPSDIGYVNDMFMGGIIYISILYGSILKFLLSRHTNRLMGIKYRNMNRVISIALVSMLLVANYKGEIMRGGTALLGAIFIKLVLNDKDINY